MLFEKSENTLLRNLYQQGIIEKNPVGLGICATPEGNVINAGNTVMPGLYAIGNLMKGVLWECTAVPELRLSAELIAGYVADYVQCAESNSASLEYRKTLFVATYPSPART